MSVDDSLSNEESQLLAMHEKENNLPMLGIDSVTEKAILEKPSRSINPAAPGIDKLVAELEQTARKLGGMGIAAIQAGIPVRVVLLWRTNNSGDGQFQPLINPNIVNVSAKRIASWEYCLSVPWGYRFTYRHAEVTVKFQTPKGEDVIETLQGDDAVVLQHEIDHLDGILLSSDRPKPWFIPADKINTFAREIWRQCQSVSKGQCDALMQSRWEERGKALSHMTH